MSTWKHLREESREKRSPVALVRGVLALAVLVIAFAVAQGASAGSAPQVTAQCTFGDTTTATWDHLRPTTVEFTWSTSTGTVSNTQAVSKAGAPRGALTVPTPAGANSVFVAVETSTGDRFGAPATCFLA